MLVRAEHLQLIAARTSSRNGLDEIHVDDKGAVACKHTPKAVERLAELFYGYAQRMVAHLAVVQKADVGVVLHRLDVDYFFDAHLKNGVVGISRKRDDVLLRRFGFFRRGGIFEPLFKMRVYGFHRLQLGLQIAVLCSVNLHHEDEYRHQRNLKADYQIVDYRKLALRAVPSRMKVAPTEPRNACENDCRGYWNVNGMEHYDVSYFCCTTARDGSCNAVRQHGYGKRQNRHKYDEVHSLVRHLLNAKRLKERQHESRHQSDNSRVFQNILHAGKDSRFLSKKGDGAVAFCPSRVPFRPNVQRVSLTARTSVPAYCMQFLFCPSLQSDKTQ